MKTGLSGWWLFSAVLAVLVLCLIVSRILISTTGEENSENYLAVNKVNQSETISSQNDSTTRLGDIERRITTKKSSGKSPDSDEIESMRRQIAMIGQQVESLKEIVLRSREKRQSEDVNVFRQYQNAVNDPLIRQNFERLQRDLSNRQYALVQESFEQEQVDRDWAIEAEDAIKTKFYQNELLSGTEINSIDCRSSTCKVTLTATQLKIDSTEDAAAQFVYENELLAAVTEELPNATIRTYPDGNGGLVYEFYLHSEGATVPQPQNPFEGKTLSEMIEFVEQY